MRNDVNELMQAMDVFLLPSRFEGLPVVLIEAQAAGLHCICSDRFTTKSDITYTNIDNNDYTLMLKLLLL